MSASAPGARKAGEEERADAGVGGIEPRIRPLGRVDRVVEAGRRVEDRSPRGGRVGDGEPPLIHPVGDDPGDLAGEALDVCPNDLARLGRESR